MMKKNQTCKRKERTSRPAVIPALGFLLLILTATVLLSGCSLKDIVDPIHDFFGKEASAEEATIPVVSEDTLMSAQVNNSAGQALVKPNGEPLTVLVAYETATGGEQHRPMPAGSR